MTRRDQILMRGEAFDRQIVCATGEIVDAEAGGHCGCVFAAGCCLWCCDKNSSKDEQGRDGQSDVDFSHLSLPVCDRQAFPSRAIDAPGNLAMSSSEFCEAAGAAALVS